MFETLKTKIDKAVYEGKAYISTYVGKQMVKSYNFETGECVTNNTDDYFQQRTFTVTIHDICFVH